MPTQVTMASDSMASSSGATMRPDAPKIAQETKIWMAMVTFSFEPSSKQAIAALWRHLERVVVTSPLR